LLIAEIIKKRTPNIRYLPILALFIFRHDFKLAIVENPTIMSRIKMFIDGNTKSVAMKVAEDLIIPGSTKGYSKIIDKLIIQLFSLQNFLTYIRIFLTDF
jgi:hypothetical protein